MHQSLIQTLITLALLSSLTIAAEYPERALSPADALARVTVPDGFAVDTIAAEPNVVQPIAICFDARGRLWAAEGLTYPNRAAEGQGKDRILIFSDEDGDGSYETRKVFIEGLNLVSGMEHGFGGVFVGAAPYLLFIPDANQDDVPDGKPEILLDGWGYEDTHETLNSFRWGPDGWLYGCHGIFTHSKVGKPGTPDADRIAINAGYWRFHPVRRDFEVFAHGTSNPWGIDFNDFGEMFAEACVIPHLWHIIPGARYQRQAGQHFNPNTYEDVRTIADHRHWVGNIADHAAWKDQDTVVIPESVSAAGGGHAHSGFSICLIDSFPAELHNDALFFNIHGHRLNHDKLKPNGSGYTGSHAPDLMMANDTRFLGLSLRQGPGNALYYADWQDDTSCHRSDSLRWDRSDGRIYRLRYGKSQPWSGNLHKASDLELATYQSGRDEWLLRTARTVLQERVADGKSLDATAVEFLSKTLISHSDPTRRLRAFWTLYACGLIAPATQLNSEDPYVLNWAIRLDAEDHEISPETLSRWIKLASKNPSPVVRLALCSALQRIPAEAAIQLAQAIAPHLDPADPNTSLLFWYGLEPLVPAHPETALELALACPDDKILGWVARRLELKDAPDRIILLLDSTQKPASLVFEALRRRLNDHTDERIGPESLHRIEKLATQGPEDLRDSASLVAVTAGSISLRDRAWSILSDSTQTREKRLDALAALSIRWQDSDKIRLLSVLAQSDTRVDIIEKAPDLLDTPDLFARLPDLTDQEKQRLLRLAHRSDRIAILFTWFNTNQLAPADMPADLLTNLRQSAKPDAQDAIEKIWPSKPAGAAPAQIAEWKTKLTAERLAAADVKNGRAVFDRTCASCHKLFGEGGEIGPELTGGDRTSLDHWLDNIVTPNALIGAGYELVQIDHDGKTSVGMLAREDKDKVALKMVGSEEAIVKTTITARKPLGISMMPENLLATMNEDETAALIAYLMGSAQVAAEK